MSSGSQVRINTVPSECCGELSVSFPQRGAETAQVAPTSNITHNSFDKSQQLNICCGPKCVNVQTEEKNKMKPITPH